MSRDAWLDERRQGIGSSDAAAACGVPSFGRSPLSVYLEKLGLMPPLVPSIAMKKGLLLEPLIFEEYESETKNVAEMPEYPDGRHTFQHPDYPWMLATPDRMVRNGPIVEGKLPSSRDGFGEPWTDQVPANYFIQAVHQMAVTGRDEVHLPALIGGDEHVTIYRIVRSESIVQMLIDMEGQLWDRIQRQEPPPIDWTADDLPRLLDFLYRPTTNLEIMVDDEDTLAAVDRYQEIGKVIGLLNTERELMKARMIARMGHASLGHLPDGRTLSRKIIPPKTITTNRQESVRLNILKAKGKNHGQDESSDGTE